MKIKHTYSTAVLTATLMLASNSLLAAPGDSSFTPSGVVVPVTEISLQNGENGGSLLYECTGTLADCGIDITDQAALDNLSTGASIEPGTYDRIGVGTCRDEGNYDATVEGSVDISGTMYYTVTPSTPGTSDILSTNSADLGPVTVNYSGCKNEYHLADPITVAEGETVTVNLFVNLENIAWARTSDSSSVPSGCQNNNLGGNNQVVCMAYPDVVAYIGAVTPDIQTYHVDIGSTGEIDGQFILMFNGDGSPIGGFSRPYYNATNTGASGFDTPLRTLESNGDGSYTLGNYGSSATSYDRFITDFTLGTNPGDISAGVHDVTSPRDAGVGYQATLQ